ncbi:hypothetical protein AUK40_01920 [Candidatus Wirthbacteria bacterium CG2_30_54_11]|uniref:FAD-binding FR-type domain-containing protein n=1 Tax=Candidatus Wirthbacteria bacterium CG2_30_54_11 TaxID=1817892 RepID=A0A1J5IN32_9BACT|nr:MAG: hypothetical protein AUK40_01920 [Candidatus Wirthbacteria bacterium CG2_30_54_11]
MGTLLIILSTILTFNFWILSKTDITSIQAFPLQSASQIAALIGTLLLSWNFILATRLPVLEDLFGGQDKVYKKHHILGIFSFVLLLHHPILLAFRYLNNTTLALRYFLPSNLLSYNLGIFALWGMIILLILTLFIKLPYQSWLFTHRLLGLPLLIASVHMFLIPSDISQSGLLRYWMFAWVGVGIVSYLYKVYLYRFLGPRNECRVLSVTLHGDIVDIVLKPVDKKMSYLPGQFVFLSTNSKGIGGESHPFSISSYGSGETIRLGIKALGDYTHRLQLLKAGDTAFVYGPYGRFSRRYLDSTKDALWIAGGIGITPFLSLFDYEKTLPSKHRTVHFIYSCVESRENTTFDAEIQGALPAVPHVHYAHFCSTKQGYLTAAKIKAQVGEVKDKLILICGPEVMRVSLTEQFVTMGVPRSNIIFEDFNLL